MTASEEVRVSGKVGLFLFRIQSIRKSDGQAQRNRYAGQNIAPGPPVRRVRPGSRGRISGRENCKFR